MKEKKVKKWIQEHKREIIVGATAIAGTAIFFILKERKVNGFNPKLNLSIRLFEGDNRDDYGPRTNSLYTNVSLNNPGLTIGELGNLGELIKKHIPNISNDCILDHLHFNYDKSEIIGD